MKFLRPTLVVLVPILALLLIVQAASAAGKGGKGELAAVGIDTILLGTPANPADSIRAEISGGGFLGGELGADSVEVTLDGSALAVDVLSADLLVADIPARTEDGAHEIVVRIGPDNKQAASATIRLGGRMIVSCISWFYSGPADEHVHTEVHVEDENGDAVLGATVTWTAENDTIGIYQTNISSTNDNDGHAAGENCGPVSGSGVTDWFCCIGAGKWDGEVPPGKRACNEGLYTARIQNVVAPPFTNMVWDAHNSEVEASIELVDPKF
jgi:hypothetical protein